MKEERERGMQGKRKNWLVNVERLSGKIVIIGC